VVIQQGVSLDVALTALGPNGRHGTASAGLVVGRPGSGRLVGADGDRRALMATIDPGLATAADDGGDEP
jgi:hypothetical protein